jgi:tetratricopeptide (TPR) repeat protein
VKGRNAVGVRDVALLDRELEATLGARPRDPAACADALERAAFACRTDPAAAERWVEAELLDELVNCYEALGRYDEAITVMRRALQVGWSGQPDGRCRIAELLMRDGRVEQATEIWEQVRVDTPDDVWLYNNAGLEYADIGDHDTALRWLTQGLQLAIATNDPEGLVDQLADLRADSLAELGLPDDDELQQQAASFVPDPTPRHHRPIRDPRRPSPTDRTQTPPALFAQPLSERVGSPRASAEPNAAPSFPARPSAPTTAATPPIALALAWFPAADYPQALTRWPELTTEGAAKGAKDHTDYNRALQRTLQDYTAAGAGRLFIAPLHIEPYLDWCTQQERDPALPGSRANYAASLAHQRDPSLIAWPPERNQRCWCESGRKYKQCCGSVRA